MLHMIVNANWMVQHVIQVKNRIMVNVNASIKSIARAKNIIVGILEHLFVRVLAISYSIIDNLVIVCDGIINATDSVLTNKTNTAPINATITTSINSENKYVRYKTDCYILYTFLLVTVFLFIITIICHDYAKKYWHTNNIKMDKIYELKKLVLKIVGVIISMTRLKLKLLI